MTAKLYLIPNTIGKRDIDLQIPQGIAKSVLPEITHYFAENITAARRFLKKIAPSININDLHFLPIGKHMDFTELSDYENILKNHTTAIISEAGNPCIADPGSTLVDMAHSHQVEVIPLVGPSAILLALIASGMNGQAFMFHGYLPKQKRERIQKIKRMESHVIQTNSTQIFMETPYRNNHLFGDILASCKQTTKLCITAGLFSENQCIKTNPISTWRKKGKIDLHKIPTIFLLGNYTKQHSK